MSMFNPRSRVVVTPEYQIPSFRQRLGLMLLGGRQTKMTATAPAILSLGPYQARWMQSDYETYSREGYIGNAYVFACIRQLSMACGGIPWSVYSDSHKTTKYDQHPYLSLLQRPNPLMGGSRFWENMVGYLSLDGNAYIERVGPNNGPPIELWPLRPDRVRVVPGTPQQLVSGYKYSVGNIDITFPAENIQHYKYWHPMSDWYGLSPLQAMSKSVDQSNQSKAWNVAMLQNGAQPTGMIVAAGNLDPEQHTRLKEQIQERYAGWMNAGRPLLMEGGATWEEMGITPRDMSWIEGQNLSAREIAMCFNIAPELIGDPASKTFSNYGEARKALYEETVLPLMDWFRDDLNNWLSPLYDGAYADYDLDGIEALQENRNDTFTRNNAAFTAGWITIDDARDAAGMEDDPVFGKLYKWQVPTAAAFNAANGMYVMFDPDNAYTPTPETAGLPHPELPPDHPLNKPAPLIPNEGDNTEPDTGPSQGETAAANGDSGGTGGGGGAGDGQGQKRSYTEAEMKAIIQQAILQLQLHHQEQKVTVVLDAERFADRIVDADPLEDKKTQALLPFLAAAKAMEEVKNGR